MKIFNYLSIDSTNYEAERLLESGIESGAVTADFQTLGHGRNGKSWQSSSSRNIYLTIFNKMPEIWNGKPFILPQISALALKKAFSGFVPEEKISIKWPNDILIDMKKCAGILGKFKQIDGVFYFIIGIGVNIELPQNAASCSWPPASLEEISGKSLKKEIVTHKIIESFQEIASKETQIITEAFLHEINWMEGKKIEFSEESETWENGKIISFSSEGSDITIEKDGVLKRLSTVSIRKIY